MQENVFYDNPQQLTKEKLKLELKKHGIELPPGNSLKAVFVDLYKEKVLIPNTSSTSFSADEEKEDLKRESQDQAEEVHKSIITPVSVGLEIEKSISSFTEKLKEESENQMPEYLGKIQEMLEQVQSDIQVRLEKIDSTNMTVDGFNLVDLSDKELGDELKRRGFSIGPVGPTTRKLYEKKLKKALEEYDEAAGGDQPTPRQQQYSDHEEEIEYEEEEEEEEEKVVVREKHRPTNPSHSPILDKGFSSAPNLTLLEYSNKPGKKKSSPPIPIPKSRRHVEEPVTPDWVNISLREKNKRNSRSFNNLASKKIDGNWFLGANNDGVGAGAGEDSYIEVVNTSSNPFNEMSHLQLNITNASSSFSDSNFDDNEMKRPDHIANSTMISNKQPMKFGTPPSTLHYSRRIQSICGSATRRRPLRSQYTPATQQIRKVEPEPEHDDNNEISEEVQSKSTEREILKPERRWLPIWVQILIVFCLVAFIYAVIQTMESNPNPWKEIPDL